ncbi:hypothetical protein [Mucilaginibacter sp. PPCGB 2223]|uniref:hypothetical protein n=1 Tax=Mucilaginibacter sp. PPCGB 2223 TaxID=1886027 RepID=UPI0011126BEB|nr:hypothetical protein [Mucilaginibacter sp. PPCGB 2223]
MASISVILNRSIAPKKWQAEDFLFGYEVSIAVIAILILFIYDEFNLGIKAVEKVRLSLKSIVAVYQVPLIGYLTKVLYMTSLLILQKMLTEQIKSNYFIWKRWRIVISTNMASMISCFAILVPFHQVFVSPWPFMIGLLIVIFSMWVNKTDLIDRIDYWIICEALLLLLSRLTNDTMNQTSCYFALSITNIFQIITVFRKKDQGGTKPPMKPRDKIFYS